VLHAKPEANQIVEIEDLELPHGMLHTSKNIRGGRVGFVISGCPLPLEAQPYRDAGALTDFLNVPLRRNV
jgi:hypothetical protein